MNRAKLSKLVADKMTELEMTQEQFAEYFSKVADNTVTYGFVQSLANPRKTSIPEYKNMRGIAKMYGITLDELDTYLEDDDIVDIKEVSKGYKKMSETISVSPDDAQHAILSSFDSASAIKIGINLIQSSLAGIEDKLKKADQIANAFKTLGLAQD
jgi:hypothetical protein